MTVSIPEFVQQMIDDIKSYRVRSATTIAKACFETMERFMAEYDVSGKTPEDLYGDFEEVAMKLALARDTEPMARNGVKYVLRTTKIALGSETDLNKIKEGLKNSSHAYFELIQRAKDLTVKYGVEILKPAKVIYTHCNSTTAENIIKGVAQLNPSLKVIADETRPRMQGRITTTKLNAAGIDVTLIADTAAASFIMDDNNLPVDAVIIGADEITMEGEAINQVGSLNVALAAYTASKPLYVVTPSLKLGPETVYQQSKIEYRDVKEVWADAPSGIQIINPVFEKVEDEFITGYICEFGMLKPKEFGQRVVKEYEWLT